MSVASAGQNVRLLVLDAQNRGERHLEPALDDPVEFSRSVGRVRKRDVVGTLVESLDERNGICLLYTSDAADE